VLKGRLGLERARIPHADRHGLLWLARGELCVIDGCVNFRRDASSPTAGIDQIPHQAVSMILLGPGGSVTHDALRLLARHGTLLAAVGDDGVRCYTAPPLLPDQSEVARRHAEVWANPRRRMSVARHMYALRLGEVLPHREIETLRGIEGARAKTMYRLMAERHGVPWRGRAYDRADPEAADLPNQAINHAATAVHSAAAIAVNALAAVPQLGFIHETSGDAFVLDIADLFRDRITLPVAFRAAKRAAETGEVVDRLVRKEAAKVFSRENLIPSMIDKVKQLLRLDEAHAAGDDHHD